jgi:hypothetical protein
MRAQRDQAAQAQAQAAAAVDTTKAVQNLAGASLEDDSALKRLLDLSQAGQAIPGA